jgi:ABC-type ATPase with predicted acetyltransferase domain
MEITMNITMTPPAGHEVITPRDCAIAQRFHLDGADPAACCAGRDIAVPLRPGTIVLITGPSGGGKSSLLRALAQRADRPPARWLDGCARPRPRRRSLLESCAAPLSSLLPALCRAGLSEPRLWLQRPHELSAGEYFRFQLARWYAGRTPLLLADEFASVLDRTTARVIAHQLRRYIDHSRATRRPRLAVLATAHDDLSDDLRPDYVVEMSM